MMNHLKIVKIIRGKKNILIFFPFLYGYYLIDRLVLNDDPRVEKINAYRFKNSLDYNHFSKIFQKKNIIFGNCMKKYLNISTPFNRKIKYIYNLPFRYPEYENYNFNKLSDFFLNIHIFIN